MNKSYFKQCILSGIIYKVKYRKEGTVTWETLALEIAVMATDEWNRTGWGWGVCTLDIRRRKRTQIMTRHYGLRLPVKSTDRTWRQLMTQGAVRKKFTEVPSSLRLDIGNLTIWIINMARLLLQVGGLSVDKVDRMELVMWMGYLLESELSFEQAPEQALLLFEWDATHMMEIQQDWRKLGTNFS